MNKDKRVINGYAASQSAQSTNNNMQWTKYHSPKGGHGFAAEDANALYERLCGHQVELVGIDNAKNGADLLIDGVPVQLKYCKDAYSTIEACFDAEGTFRYSGKDIMVPKDQYEEALARMRQKISEGKVPGVSDPKAADQIIRRGNITRSQAENIKKFGTKESLTFDALTQAQVAGFIGGISALGSFVSAILHGKCVKDATIEASKEFGKTSGKVLVSGVATQQFLRTEAGRKAATITTHAVRKSINAICETEAGRKIIGKFAQGVGSKVVNGAAARTVATRAIRGNIITSTIVFTVDSVPDTFNLCRGKMSWKDFGKSRSVGAAGVAVGSVGYMMGVAIGTAICPGIGTTVGGFVGGILGGMGGASGAKKALSFV